MRERRLETVEVVPFLFIYIISFLFIFPSKKKKERKVEPMLILVTDLNQVENKFYLGRSGSQL